MNKLGTKELHTDRLILRKLNIDDAEQLYLNVFSDDKTAQYMAWDVYSDIDSVKKCLTKWQEQYKLNECYWGVFTKDTNTLVGAICLSNENSRANIAFVSYCLGSKYWGNGFITESLKVVIKYAFSELQYRMITAFCADSNKSSQKILIRLGFKYEATLRQRDLTVFGYEDCLQYSLMVDEMKI